MNLKNGFMAFAALASLAGCASTMPMNGGIADDHETTVAQCGVGNYTFRYLKETCGTTHEAPVAVVAPAPTKVSAPVEVSKVAHLVNNKIEIDQAVTFKTGSAAITKDGKKVLDEVAAVIHANGSAISKINIEGHTDTTGNPTKNMSLSEARADSVKQYLSKKGIDSGKMSAKGFGQTKPKFDPANATKTQLSANRRVEFEIESSRN